MLLTMMSEKGVRLVGSSFLGYKHSPTTTYSNCFVSRPANIMRRVYADLGQGKTTSNRSENCVYEVYTYESAMSTYLSPIHACLVGIKLSGTTT